MPTVTPIATQQPDVLLDTPEVPDAGASAPPGSSVDRGPPKSDANQVEVFRGGGGATATPSADFRDDEGPVVSVASLVAWGANLLSGLTEAPAPESQPDSLPTQALPTREGPLVRSGSDRGQAPSVTLARGARGPDVEHLQNALVRLGYLSQESLRSGPGVFGPQTEAALKRFQSDHGLEVDGVFGPRSRAALAFSENPARPGPTPSPVASQPSVSVAVAFISQFDSRVPRAGDTACFRACQEMMRGNGIELPSTAKRIQVANGEDALGRVQTTRRQAESARRYLDEQLAAGKPVTVGVSHIDAGYNRDGITDHFVVITGRGIDEQGRQYYTYNDPAVRDPKAGTGERFYVDDATGKLIHQGVYGQGLVLRRHTEVSMVVLNS